MCCEGCAAVGQQIATRRADLILAHQYDRAWLRCACGYPTTDRTTWAHHVAQLTQGGAA